MRISFCMIIFNEAKTLRANLAHLYGHAHEIIVCEGSVAKLREVCGAPERSDDGTLQILDSFPDPEGKIRLIQKAWLDKNEMARAYGQVATGDMIWHVDADEFYDEYSLDAVQKEFADPDLMTLDVPMHVFWKSPRCVLVDERGDDRWFRYARVLRRTGGMSVQHIPIRRVIDGRPDESGHRGPTDDRIRGWHYAWNCDRRVRLKMKLYDSIYARTTRPDWLERVWDRWRPGSPDSEWPDGVHPSHEWRLWPRAYEGPHPAGAGAILAGLDCLQTPVEMS